MMPVGSGARFNANRTRRRLLWRAWDNKKPLCNFICLNPSTADEKKNDQSVTKMVGFSERLGAGSLVVTNLFDIMTTFPKDLYNWFADRELNSRTNDRTIIEFANQATWVILAWGSHGKLLERDREVVNMLAGYELRRRMMTLKLNMDGTPAHPLMLSYSCIPQRFKIPGSMRYE